MTTAIAGVVLAALSVSAFGSTPTVFAFLALGLLATVVGRAIARHRRPT